MKESSNRYYLAYELTMAALALAVAVVLFIEFTRPQTEEQAALLTNIDLSILAIFAVDYFYRLAKAQNKWQFFKSNIFDLIAIIPFDKAFRIARLVRLVRLVRLSRTTRLTRVLRLTRLIRITIFLRKVAVNFKGVFRTNGLIYIVIVTIAIVFGGAFGIMLAEPGMETFGDAIWWSLVTTTTVGYGDISPESTGGRVIAGILMIVGIGFLGMVTGSVATYFVDRLSRGQEQGKKTVLDEQVEYVKSKLDELDNLEYQEVKLLCGVIEETWKRTKQ